MYIVYQTTNKINNKIYVGIHDTSKNQQNGFYYGSGVALKNAIKKYGKDNFVRVTLFEYSILEEALQKEKEIVTEEFVNDLNTYNMTVGGNSPPNSKQWWNEKHSKATSDRMKGNRHKLGKIESEESRIKKSLALKASKKVGRWLRTEKHKEQQADRARQQMLLNNPMNNPEFRAKISESKKGRRKIIKDNMFKYVKPEDLNYFLGLGRTRRRYCEK